MRKATTTLKYAAVVIVPAAALVLQTAGTRHP